VEEGIGRVIMRNCDKGKRIYPARVKLIIIEEPSGTLLLGEYEEILIVGTDMRFH
jgi:hypothetical protein